MFEIIIIDGGESGQRINRIVKLIRKEIPISELKIQASKNRKNDKGEFFSINNYNLAFIHSSDNVGDYSEPIFTIEAKNNSIPLVLYSGGIKGFNLIEENICEINDSLLENHITDFLMFLLKNNFKNIDFKYLYPGEKFLNLEKLFEFRKKLIFNHEHSSLSEINNIYEEFINFTKSLNLNIKILSFENFVDPNNAFDMNSILKFINKSTLKYEQLITKI